MRYEHDGGVGLGANGEQLILEPVTYVRIERGKRLVHQQDRRTHRQRASKADALVLAAG